MVVQRVVQRVVHGSPILHAKHFTNYGNKKLTQLSSGRSSDWCFLPLKAVEVEVIILLCQEIAEHSGWIATSNLVR